ncbi:MAG: cysteine methyltransferase [Nanoarchaeota archaeon]|jgi:methylated-DNA-[protein]-cysteine S-methyltransferase|nr:cysteine methyltransferase [Nanoarchaeota archaeon]|tara:strand:+ start:12768 stop:13082 length:315 start_codon:yes stop_codon:yes gene_type:complete
MTLAESIYKLCKQIPKGKISTYKELGKTLNIKAYQAIGRALKKNPDPENTPCFKIIKSNGEIGGYAGKITGKKIEEKIKRLKSEGIEIKQGKIELSKYLHRFDN